MEGSAAETNAPDDESDKLSGRGRFASIEATGKGLKGDSSGSPPLSNITFHYFYILFIFSFLSIPLISLKVDDLHDFTREFIERGYHAEPLDACSELAERRALEGTATGGIITSSGEARLNSESLLAR